MGGAMTGGEHSRHDKMPDDQIAEGSAEIPRKAKFHAIGEQGAVGGGREEVFVPPVAEGTLHADIDEMLRRLHEVPASGPPQGERSLLHGDAKLFADAGLRSGGNFQDAQPWRRDGAEVGGVFVKAEKFIRGGGHERRVLENSHGGGVFVVAMRRFRQ